MLFHNICSLLCSVLLFSSSGSAVSYSNNDNPYLFKTTESGDVLIHGAAEGFEHDLEPLSNSYAVVGDDESSIFVLAYDWNRNNPDKNCGFDDTGLYQNSDSHEIIYQIPSPEYDSTAVISDDGNTVWIVLDSELPFGNMIPIDMTYPVIRKYSGGELQYSVSLNDIYSSAENLFCLKEDDMCAGYYWCHLNSVTPEALIFKDDMTEKDVYIDRQTGKATGLEQEEPDQPEEQTSHVWTFVIAAIILMTAIILLTFVLMRKKHQKNNS